jgi:hypothetical protein
MQDNEKLNTCSTFEFEVRVKSFDKSKGEMIEAFASNAKLTKADAGRYAAIQEDWIDVLIDPSEKYGEQPKITVQSHSKLTKADSGRG